MGDGFDGSYGGGPGGGGRYGHADGTQGGGAGGGMRPPTTHSASSFADAIIKLRGLPFSATSQEISEWFSEVGLQTPIEASR